MTKKQVNAPRHLSTYLYKSRNIVLEMLEHRGFKVEEYKNFTPTQMNILAADITTSTPEPIISSTEMSHIEVHYFLNKANITPKNISGVIETILEKLEKNIPKGKPKSKDLILLVLNKPTQNVASAVNELYKTSGTYIQVFPLKYLMFNVTKHNLLPPHKKMATDFFEKELKRTLMIDDPAFLPHVLNTDPVSMFIGLRPNEIVEIQRPSKSAGTHMVYRYCVNGFDD